MSVGVILSLSIKKRNTQPKLAFKKTTEATSISRRPSNTGLISRLSPKIGIWNFYDIKVLVIIIKRI